MPEHISAEKCFQLLKNDNNCHLIDVRMPMELENYGSPDIAAINKNLHLITWSHIDGTLNKNFLDQVKGLNLKNDAKLFFMCKSGIRSQHAGAHIKKNLENIKVYNIEGGFELGWKSSNLSITYSQQT